MSRIRHSRNEPSLHPHWVSDCTTSQGTKFWTFPKRAPRPLEFDPSDEAHLGFVVNLAKAWGFVCKVSSAKDI